MSRASLEQRGQRFSISHYLQLPAPLKRFLRGRCPRHIVRLPTIRIGTGADSTSSTWKPSSPHSTSWLMISSSPAHQNTGPFDKPTSARARSSPSPSSADGRDSPESEISTVTLAINSEKRSPPCPAARSSTASCVSMPTPSKRGPYIWRRARRAADMGWSNSLGWYKGFPLLTYVKPTGMLKSFGFRSASTVDQRLAETFFAVRAYPTPRLPSAGPVACPPCVADKGFESTDNQWRLARMLRSGGRSSSRA